MEEEGRQLQMGSPRSRFQNSDAGEDLLGRTDSLLVSGGSMIGKQKTVAVPFRRSSLSQGRPYIVGGSSLKLPGGPETEKGPTVYMTNTGGGAQKKIANRNCSENEHLGVDPENPGSTLGHGLGLASLRVDPGKSWVDPGTWLARAEGRPWSSGGRPWACPRECFLCLPEGRPRAD